MRARLVATFAAALLAGAAGAPVASALAPGDTVDPDIADGSAQRALDAARARWRAFDVHSYRYRAQLQCFCTPGTIAPAVLVVRAGKPVDPPARLRGIATVPRIFRRVQEAIDDRVAGLSVRYGKRGVPRSVQIDPSLMIADEEIGYVVGRVRRL
jgi:hypothetical protein